MVYRIPIKSLVENVPKVYIKKLLKLNLIRWTWRHKLQQSTSKVLSDFPSSHKPLPYYISSTAFSHEEDVKTHIKTKNNEVLQALPLTFSFNYRNKAFFNGIQKYHLLSPATQKTELEKAVFPETTLIPFRKKLQALVLGLRHFRVSEELKDKLERLVHENTIKYRSNQRKEEDYHVDFLNEEEEEEKEDEKDLLAAFKGSFSRERKEKKTLNKKENPLLVLSNNLGLKLNGRGSNIKEKELFPLKNIVKGSLGINDSLKDKEKDLGHINNQIRENDRILRRKSLKSNRIN